MEDRIEGGFVLLARQITASSLWQMDDSAVRLAIYFLAEANHRDVKWYDKYQLKEIIIRRGEIVGTRQRWAKANKKTRKAFRTAFGHLLRHGFIQEITATVVKRAQGYTHLCIPKYEKYQDVTKYLGSKRAQGGPSAGPGRAQDGPIPKQEKQGKQVENSASLVSSSEDTQEANTIARCAGNPLTVPKSPAEFQQRLATALKAITPEQWRRFDGVDVDFEVTKMRNWVDGYWQTARVTRKKDWKRFVLNWMMKARVRLQLRQENRDAERS